MAIENLEHAERAFLVQEWHGHQCLRDETGALGRFAPEPRILGDVLEHERLVCDEHPARDARARGQPAPHQRARAFSRDRFEHELVVRLVK